MTISVCTYTKAKKIAKCTHIYMQAGVQLQQLGQGLRSSYAQGEASGTALARSWWQNLPGARPRENASIHTGGSHSGKAVCAAGKMADSVPAR